MNQSDVVVAGIAAGICLVGVISADAAELAMSLVYKNERIEIPAKSIRRIEAISSIVIVFPDARGRKELPRPSVEVCYAKNIQEQICKLTRRIVDEPMELIAGCEVISKPVVREPICGPCITITAYDMAEAEAIADKIRNNSKTSCIPGVATLGGP